MKKFLLISLTLLTAQAHAQNPPVWNQAFNGSLLNAKGIALGKSDSMVWVWGEGRDTACLYVMPALLGYTPGGSYVSDTAYDINYCASESTLWGTTRSAGPGILLSTQNDVPTPADTHYVYAVGNTWSIDWSENVGNYMLGEPVQYGTGYYVPFRNTSTIVSISKLDDAGNSQVVNTLAYPYYQNAFVDLRFDGNNLFEFGTQPFHSDTAFVCAIHDTLGTSVATFSYDADPLAEEMLVFSAVRNNTIIHVCRDAAIPVTYFGACDNSGAPVWQNTVNHPYRAACIDTVHSVGYILVLSAPAVFEIFSYSLQSGALLDSVEVDSCVALTRIKSGPAGGVYFMYTKGASSTLTLDQYDQGLNLLWRGETSHPNCSQTCLPQDFVIDSLGYVYTVSDCSSCPEKILTNKFAPSLVNVSEENAKMTFDVFPNPASDQFTISAATLPGVKSIRLTSISGQELFSDSFVSDRYVINAEPFASGIYIVEVTTDSGLRLAQKLIISHP